MLHDHVFLSHFPQFDRLEGILDAWPRQFTSPPLATQPVHIDDGTIYVLSCAPDWTEFIERRQVELVGGLRDSIDPELALVIRRIEVVPTSATAIYLARQLIVIFARLRDLGAEF